MPSQGTHAPTLKAPTLPFRRVRRHASPAPIPFIADESGLPRGQRALVFLPHSDDGRYFGATLYLMNRRKDGVPRNQVRIAIVSPGWGGVEGDASREEKAQRRLSEAICWAAMLGYRPQKVTPFRADATYEQRGGIDADDQARMNEFVAAEEPTMIFIPHIDDTVQHANFNTRRMVFWSLRCWIEERLARGEACDPIFVLEYPTNHVPLLPPADKNLFIVFTDPAESEIKHHANRAHESQRGKGFNRASRMVEAFDAMTGADDINQIRRLGSSAANYLTGIDLNPMTSRGEHFGVTKFCIVDGEETPSIVERKVSFPLDEEDAAIWYRE